MSIILPGDNVSKTPIMTELQLKALRAGYDQMRSVEPGGPIHKKMVAFVEKLSPQVLYQIVDAKIPFLTPLARERLDKRWK